MNQPWEACEVIDVADSLGIWCNNGDPAKWLAYRRDGRSELEPSGSWADWVALAHAILERDEGPVTYVGEIASVNTGLPADGAKLLFTFLGGGLPRQTPLKPGDHIILDIVANHRGEILEIIPRWPREGEVPA